VVGKAQEARSICTGESADGNFAITNVEAHETRKKKKRRNIENGVYFAVQRRVASLCLQAASLRSTIRRVYAFQTYDAFSVAIKEIMSRANYDNHNIIATCLLYSKSTLPLVIDSDSYRKKTFESHADKLYVRSIGSLTIRVGP